LKIIVIGGGIGGLATALSLHEAGIAVRVFETVQTLTALGVGINIQASAVRELSELGLAADIEATAIATSTLGYFNKHGQKIWSEPRGRAAGYNWPQYSIHRGEFLMLLARAVRARLGEENLLLGHHLESFEDDGRTVTAHFIDRRSGKRIHTEVGDALIGADGIHSAVREKLHPGDGALHFDGMLMWRAAVETEPFLDGRTQAIIGHQGQRFVAYPMSAAAERRGRSMTNWIAELRVPGDTPPRADWNKRVDKSAFAPLFKDWKFPWLDVPAIIDATEAIYEFPKVDRDPLSRWSFGRITLIGDAAHPMLPTGSQAGTQAVMDSRYITRALLEEKTPEAAFARFESERRPLMSEITLRNRQLGPEAAMQVVEERAPGGFKNVEDVISRQEMEEITGSFKKLAGFDREQVNTRPPIVTLPNAKA
jgi:2-polyprenyl-6-methoxyphenol hydroxylase-like FAD-dependent oxidoreductase